MINVIILIAKDKIRLERENYFSFSGCDAQFCSQYASSKPLKEQKKQKQKENKTNRYMIIQVMINKFNTWRVSRPERKFASFVLTEKFLCSSVRRDI